MRIPVTELLTELTFKTSRSGGKGGQNVNKVSTKVELNFDVIKSSFLDEETKELLQEKWKNRLTKEGVLQLVSQSERTQLGNKRVVLEKFQVMYAEAFQKQKPRKATKIPKSVIEKRLQVKKRRAEIKKNRGGIF